MWKTQFHFLSIGPPLKDNNQAASTSELIHGCGRHSQPRLLNVTLPQLDHWQWPGLRTDPLSCLFHPAAPASLPTVISSPLNSTPWSLLLQQSHKFQLVAASHSVLEVARLHLHGIDERQFSFRLRSTSTSKSWQDYVLRCAPPRLCKLCRTSQASSPCARITEFAVAACGWRCMTTA